MPTPGPAAIREQLSQAFEPRQAQVLSDVLADAIALRERYVEEMSQVRQEMTHLAEAQQRTEQRVGQLAEAQQRTEQRVGQLAEAQQRTEQRVGQLAEAQQRTEQRVGQLAEAQQRTEQRVGQLAEAQQRTEVSLQRLDRRVEQLTEVTTETRRELALLARQVGGLSDKLGGSLEDLARETVPAVLADAWGLERIDCDRECFLLGDREEEVDLVLRALQPDGTPLVVLGEVKSRLTGSEVDTFLAKVSRLRPLLGETAVRVLFFGFQANFDARERIREAGAYMVFSNGRLL